MGRRVLAFLLRIVIDTGMVNFMLSMWAVGGTGDMEMFADF